MNQCLIHEFMNLYLIDFMLNCKFSSDPSAIQAACHEYGLSQGQCKLFAKAFQLIERFFFSNYVSIFIFHLYFIFKINLIIIII